MKVRIRFVVVLAMLLASAHLAHAAKGTIKAKANGKFKANIVKSVIYTGASRQLAIAATQRRGATAKTLTITCFGVDLVPGPLQCILTYAILQPLKGVNSLWATGDGGTATVSIDEAADGKITLSFSGSALGNSSSGGKALTISNGVVKMPLQQF